MFEISGKLIMVRSGEFDFPRGRHPLDTPVHARKDECFTKMMNESRVVRWEFYTHRIVFITKSVTRINVAENLL